MVMEIDDMDNIGTDFGRTKMFLDSIGIPYRHFDSVSNGKTVEISEGYSGRRGVFLLKLVFAFDDKGYFLERRLCDY